MNIDGKALSAACKANPNKILAGEFSIASQLCRSGMDEFMRLAKGSNELLVACTQEAPIFLDALDELDGNMASVRFTNIREKAGWSKDAKGNLQQRKKYNCKDSCPFIRSLNQYRR